MDVWMQLVYIYVVVMLGYVSVDLLEALYKKLKA